MIEGLKVTVGGEKLRGLAVEQADHHAERVTVYAQQIASMEASKVEGIANMTNGDPVGTLKQRKAMHENEERELRFIADNLDGGENYLLDRDALRRLGIVTDRAY